MKRPSDARHDDVLGSFERSYRVWTFSDLDATWDVAFAIPSGLRSEHSASVLMVEDGAGATWDVKLFDMNLDRDHVFSTSDPHVFCALAGGHGYFIDARKPGIAMDPHPDPGTLRLFTDISLGQLIYVDDHGLEAFGPGGKQWTTGVDGCGISDIAFHGRLLSAIVTDYAGEYSWSIEVDRTTGKLVRSIS